MSTIGEAAGLVWNCLHENGPLTPNRLAKETGLSTNELNRALGWLAREDKVSLARDGRKEVLSLTEE